MPRALHAALLAVTVGGCAPGGERGAERDASAPTTARASFSPPALTRAIDPTRLRLSLVLNGTPFELDAEPWELQVRVEPGNTILIDLAWSDDTGLTLATYTASTVTIESDGTVEVPREAYLTARHDEDGDGFSNLDERRCGTDPRVATSRPPASPGGVLTAADGTDCATPSRVGATCFTSGHLVTLPEESGPRSYRVAPGTASREVTLLLTRPGRVEVEDLSGSIADSTAELFDPELRRIDVDDDSGTDRRFLLRTGTLDAGEYCFAHGAFGELPAPAGGWNGVHEYRFVGDDG